MRRGEVLNLEPRDLNLERASIHIRQGKWGKERMLPLPQSLYPLLKEYVHFYKPTVYLFEGQKKDQYSPTSIARIVDRAAKKVVSIKKSPAHAATQLRDPPLRKRRGYALHPGTPRP